MILNTTRFKLPAGRYFADPHPKDLVVLHFTAGGSVAGAVACWLGQKDEVATPYIVDVDGVVYATFDPKFWAYHLGVVGPQAQNHKHDKRSVPIEIVGFGPLKLKGDTLCSWPGNYTNPYCGLTEKEKYVHSSFRGSDYFTAFPEAQKQAVVELVRKISEEFQIPLAIPPVEHRGSFDLSFFDNWKGIASHQNFRSDKSDIGPAWSVNDWEKLHA
jgi:N-acetyl-anhydromuramyl-L-alanine amidase AmpD